MRRHRGQCVARIPFGELGELLAGSARALELSHGKHDLDVGRQQTGSLERLRRLADRPADRGRGGITRALGQPQQGEPRLRLASVSARLPVGRLGLGERAAQAMDLALLVQRLAARQLIQDALGEVLGGACRLVQGVRPRAMQLHDLGAMHEAQAHVGDHRRLLLAPPGQRLAPLLRVAQLVDGRAERDGVAVDDAGDDRRELPCGRREQDLVRQPQALLDPPPVDQGSALLVARQPHQVGIAEALPDVGGGHGSGTSGFPVPARHLLQPQRDEQVAALDAVAPVSLQEPLRTAEPPGRAHGLSAEQHVVADPEGAARRRPRVARIGMEAVRAFQPIHVVVVAAKHVGSPRERLEVRRLERALAVRDRQRVVGIHPLVASEALAAPFELAACIHDARLSAGRWESGKCRCA
jgi:hypothetical protein